MNPDEYVRECLFPGDPVGYQFCEIICSAPIFHWGPAEIQKAKDLVMERYQDAPRFPFPRAVRYG